MDKAGERANGNMNSRTDHHMLKLTSLNQVAHLTLGDPNTCRKLLRRLQPIV